MAHPLSWKWLCSQLGAGLARPRSQARFRPCLAALEHLEDRVVPSTTGDPIYTKIPLSAQSLAAVDAFLKLENAAVAAQGTFLKMENSFIKQSNNQLPSAIVNYFLKIDGDLLKLDTDLIGQQGGTTAPTAAAGSIDAILIGLKIPVDTDIALESQLVPAVNQELQQTNTLIGLLNASPVTKIHPSAQVDYFLKLDGITGESVAAAGGIMANLESFEYKLMGADANDLGPALGLQGAATPGPVGGFLQDLAVLTADIAATPTNNTGGLVGSSSAVALFLKYQDAFHKDESVFLKFEEAALANPKVNLTSGDLAYFIKIDGDLLQIDNDLFVPPNSSAATGVDAALAQWKLPAATLQHVQKLESQIGNDAASAAKALSDAKGYRDIIGDLNGDGLPDLRIVKEWEASSPGIAAFENVLISLDTTGQLGPALGQQGSSTQPGLMGGLLQDTLVLSADAAGTFPGAITYPPPTVVNAFLKLEGQIVQTQNDIVAVEQGFIKLGAQLPSAIVDYFLKLDDAVLQIDAGLLDTQGSGATNPGIDTILAGLSGMPAAYVTKINSLAASIKTGQGNVLQVQGAVQQNAGGTPTAADVQSFLKIDRIQDKFQAAFAGINSSFLKIENEFLGVDPASDPNYNAFVQDNKNISDGAAKGQAVD